MATIWTKSTEKHHVSRDNALHAMLNATYYERAFNPARKPGAVDPSLIIGPAKNGRLMEVMFEEARNGDVIVFHVMPARPKILARLNRTAEGTTDVAAAA